MRKHPNGIAFMNILNDLEEAQSAKTSRRDAAIYLQEKLGSPDLM
jgi:hypothetical protein